MRNTIRITLVCGIAAVLISGCATFQTQTSAPSEVKLSIVIAEDQSISINGETATITELVRRLEALNPGKHIRLSVSPDSKVRQETIQKIIEHLNKDGYSTELLSPSQSK